MTDHLCIGWLDPDGEECPSSTTQNHGCHLPVKHSGLHECVCGATIHRGIEMDQAPKTKPSRKRS